MAVKKKKKYKNKNLKKKKRKKVNSKKNKNKYSNKRKNVVNSKNNVKDSKLKENKNIDDSIEIKDSEFNIENESRENNFRYLNIFLIIFMIFGLGFVVLCFPCIKLLGEENIVISYKDSYVEDGYVFNFFNDDLSGDVEVDDNIVNGVVGEYQVNYYVDKFGIRFKKVRNVSIIDDEKPEIDVDNDVINICPNEDVPDFKYKAIDEYDGDITSLVEKTILNDEVLLSVKDSSGNEAELSIKIDRNDSVSPVIKLNGYSIIYLNYGDEYIDPGYTVSDNCTDNLDDKVVVSGSVGRDIGTYILTYEVSDDSGNKSSVSRKVIVGTRINDNGVVNNGSIYLTFDDGPNEGTTNKILDILKEEGVKATFFVTCNGSDNLIKRIYDEGHTVALHTASHDYSYIYSSVDNYFADLNKVSDRVRRITGVESKIIRFPGGSSNMISRNYKVGIMTELTNLVLNQGYLYFDWNVDAMDASSARTSSDVYYNVTSNLSMNRANVVLMHDTKSITVGALRNIIRFGKENGYKFREIDMNTHMVRHSVNN